MYVNVQIDILWERKHLHVVMPSWLICYGDRLVSVNISHNNLNTLPAELPWQLRSLKTFIASHSHIEVLHVSDSESLACRGLVHNYCLIEFFSCKQEYMYSFVD